MLVFDAIVRLSAAQWLVTASVKSVRTDHAPDP